MGFTGSGKCRANAKRSPTCKCCASCQSHNVRKRCDCEQRMLRPLAKRICKTDLRPTDHTKSVCDVTISPDGVTAMTSGVCPTRSRIDTRRPSANITKVSPVTHSRKSDMTGRLFGRCSRLRLSCDKAITGTLSSLASAFKEREISEISAVRLSPLPVCINCK